jgi:hypothetical protein
MMKVNNINPSIFRDLGYIPSKKKLTNTKGIYLVESFTSYSRKKSCKRGLLRLQQLKAMRDLQQQKLQ